MTNWIVTILTLTALLLWPLAPRRAAALWTLAASILLCELYRPGAFDGASVWVSGGVRWAAVLFRGS
jgi:hypothetical protein